MNAPVNFELAKLLKEKGFDKVSTSARHKNSGELVLTDWDKIESVENILIPEAFNLEEESWLISAPTVADVVMWLYEKHGIWIIVAPIPYSDNLTHWRWEHVSTNYSTRNARWKKEQDYMSPTEAYEAAIKYCLNKLI